MVYPHHKPSHVSSPHYITWLWGAADRNSQALIPNSVGARAVGAWGRAFMVARRHHRVAAGQPQGPTPSPTHPCPYYNVRHAPPSYSRGKGGWVVWGGPLRLPFALFEPAIGPCGCPVVTLAPGYPILYTNANSTVTRTPCPIYSITHYILITSIGNAIRGKRPESSYDYRNRRQHPGRLQVASHTTRA